VRRRFTKEEHRHSLATLTSLMGSKGRIVDVEILLLKYDRYCGLTVKDFEPGSGVQDKT
jgi:hypothetical protein